MTKAVYTIEGGELNKKGTLLADNTNEVLIYETNEKGYPKKLIQRIKI